MFSTYNFYRTLRDRLELFRISSGPTAYFPPYTSSTIRSQIIKSISNKVFEYTLSSASFYRQTGSIPLPTTPITCKSFSFNSQNHISIPFLPFINHFIKAITYWAYILYVLIFSVRFKVKNTPYTLVYGIPYHNLFTNDSDSQFIQFCENSHIDPLTRKLSFLIQAPVERKSTTNSNFIYTKYPLLRLFRLNGVTFSSFIGICISHIIYLVYFIFSSLRYPPSVLLYRDYLEHSLFSYLDRNDLINDFIYTTTNYQYQILPSWALPGRSFTSHLLWYSHSFFPLVYDHDSYISSITALSFIQIDKHWVWSECFQDLLTEVSPSAQYAMCPPIIWQPFNTISRSKSTNRNTLRISLFDVTPVSLEWEFNHGLIRNYISYENVKQFLDDIITVSSRIESDYSIKITLDLKPKRTYGPQHSLPYLNYISELSSLNKIKLVDPDSQLVDLISSTDVSCVFPYSSPVYVARHLSVPSFWYDPTSLLRWPLSRKDVPLVQGIDNLYKQLLSILDH